LLKGRNFIISGRKKVNSPKLKKKSHAKNQQLKTKLLYEQRARKAGFRNIAGIDEAGRGPLAGPVIACALILKTTRFIQKIDDSKKLTPKARNLAYVEILKKAHIGLGSVDEKLIDKINIYQATRLAMEKAVSNLKKSPDFLLIDGRIRVKTPCKKSNIIEGDTKSMSIACASIVAKVTRDKIMKEYHKQFPNYAFDRHKGYGTKLHIKLLKKHGPCRIHRKTFKPVTTCVIDTKQG